MSDNNPGNHQEDPRQTGRIAAYHFFIDVLLMNAGRHWDRDMVAGVKTTIRQVLRGNELLMLNPTRKRNPDGTYGHEWPAIARRSLGSNLGGFGEGLREGLEEILKLVLERYPDPE